MITIVLSFKVIGSILVQLQVWLTLSTLRRFVSV